MNEVPKRDVTYGMILHPLRATRYLQKGHLKLQATLGYGKLLILCAVKCTLKSFKHPFQYLKKIVKRFTNLKKIVKRYV